MATDQDIEREIQAKGLTAPRITPADIEANIASEYYFTAAQGVGGANVCADDDDSRVRVDTNSPLHLLTFCVLVLRNGFTVTGESACASPENFDAEVGRKVARADAVRQVWPLMGYALKEKLASQPADWRDRVRAEAQELTERMAKLEAFLATDTFTGMDQAQQVLMRMQLEGMTLYSRALHVRIATFA